MLAPASWHCHQRHHKKGIPVTSAIDIVSIQISIAISIYLLKRMLHDAMPKHTLYSKDYSIFAEKQTKVLLPVAPIIVAVAHAFPIPSGRAEKMQLHQCFVATHAEP